MRRVFVLVTAIAVASLVFAASVAQAATMTVGSPLTATPVGHFGGSATEVNVALSEPGARTASPVNGMITSYRVDVQTLGMFAIRAIRPAADGEYTGAGSSPPVMAGSTGLQTFAANVPVRAGDLIGLDLDDNAGRSGDRQRLHDRRVGQPRLPHRWRDRAAGQRLHGL